MSGSKRATVQISQEEYDRLRSIETNLGSENASSKEEEQRIHQQTVESIRAGMGRISDRQQEYEQEIRCLNDSLYRAEFQTNQRLIIQQEELYQTISSQQVDTWQQVHQMIEASIDQFQVELQNQYAQNQSNLQEVVYGMNGLLANQQNKKEMADEWIAYCDFLSNFIDRNYDHPFFMPGQWLNISEQMNLAQANINQGLFETAISTLQDNYFRLSKMRVDLEAMENEWRMAFYATWEKANQIRSLYMMNEFIPAIDLDGNYLDDVLELNFWTNSQWLDTLKKLDNIIQYLADPQIDMNAQDLKKIRDQDLENFLHSLDEMLKEARIAALNSQMRINIADLVVESLNEQGFTLTKAHFQKVDMRQSFKAWFSGYDGSEVVIRVAPVGNKIGENELQVDSHDQEFRTEHELKQRWTEINRSLNQRGLVISNQQMSGLPSAPEPQHMVKPGQGNNGIPQRVVRRSSG
jgi:hypothetical protein